jgi:hypothetical protein
MKTVNVSKAIGTSSTYLPVKMAGQFALRLGYDFKL